MLPQRLLTTGRAVAAAQVMGWLKSFSIVPFWLHVSFITGSSSSSLFPWTTLRLKRCVPCFVEDPMWSVLSDPPTLGSTARDNRLEKKLPFLCWVYKHLFSFFFLFSPELFYPRSCCSESWKGNKRLFVEASALQHTLSALHLLAGPQLPCSGHQEWV